MRQLLLGMGMLLFSLISSAQSVIYHENFDPSSLADSVTSNGTPLGWAVSSRLSVSGPNCDTNYVQINDTSYLVTSAFSTTGLSYVFLDFDHICKTEIVDGGEIQVSVNNGPWTKLTATEYIDPGNSQFVNSGNKFCGNTYPIDWQSTNAIAKPQQSWWKHETFNISLLVGNQANVRIRFALRDGNMNGSNGARGWFLDNIKVTASFSELTPPTITYIAPNFQGTVYNLGPFNIKAKISDGSGIQKAYTYYKVNNSAIDSVLMTVTGGDTMVGIIPSVLNLDTVKYYIKAWDNSLAHNSALNPNSGFRSFVATSGITFPYIDNFDGAGLTWVDTSLTAGSNWELGTPAYGTTNSAHSAPNAWDVNLNTIYGAGANCMLFSPVFDFSSTVNAKMSFWLNYYVEQGWDGTRIDYTIDGITWNVLGAMGDPNGVNWYNYASLNSSQKPGWSYQSGGWVKCEYTLTQLNNVVGPVQFRFVFTSDGSGQYDGISMDDFSIVPPYPLDAGAEAALTPDFNTCLVSGNHNVTAVIKNFGSLTMHGPVNIAYKLDNGAPVVEAWNDSLVAGAIDTFAFSTPMTVTAGNHTIKIYTMLSGDGLSFNDTLTVNFSVLAPIALPYFNDLDSLASLNDFCITTGAQGRVDFLAAAGNNSPGGIAMDVNNYINWNISNPDTNILSPYYCWLPTVNPSHLATTKLVVNTTGYSVLKLKFDAMLLYAYANEYTNFRVTVNGTMITPHMSPAGANSLYTTYEYMLSSFLPAPYLIIEFQSKVYYPRDYTTPNGNGVYLDNIQIFEPPAQEAKLLKVTSPNDGCGLGMEDVTIQFKNTGSDTIFGNLAADYQIAGATAIPAETIPGTFAPGDTALYTFSVQANLAVVSADSTFVIKAWIALPGDPFAFNDTLVKSVGSKFIPAAPVVTAVYDIPYATDTLLHASSPVTVYWYDQPSGGNYLVMSHDYTTPILYDTAYFYVEAKNGSGGTDFDIGTGNLVNTTYSYPCPYGNYYKGAKQQMLIPASELLAAGMGPGPIQGCAFDVVSPAGSALSNFNIKIAATNINSLTSWTNTGLTQVYNVSSFTNTIGWNSHLFSTPFIWDGVSNILIETCFDNYPSAYTTNAILNQSTTTYASTLDYHSDGGSVCPSPPSYFNAIFQRPNIRFKGTSSGCSSNRVMVQVNVTGIPPFDAGVVAIDTPNTAINLTAAEPISVRIKNFGSSAISGFPVSFQINNFAPLTEIVSTTIQPGDTLSYLFTGTAGLGMHAIYNLKAFTGLSGDNTHINDTAYKSVENQMPVYCASGAATTADDDITHVTFAGINNSSPSPYNGTYSDYTALTPAHCFLGNSYPVSVGIGFSGSYGYAGYVEAYIDFNANGIFEEPSEVVWGSAYTNQLTQTLTGTINIPVTATAGLTRMRIVAVESGDAVSVTPCAYYYYGETEDYNVFISPLLHKDAGVLAIVKPEPAESEGTPIPVKLVVKNYGLDTLSAFDIKTVFNGTAQVFPWSGTLFPSAVDTVSLPSVTLNPGMNLLVAYTVLTGDSNAFNDTAIQHCFGIPPILYYNDNFEQNNGWTVNSGSLWQRGVPTATTIHSVHSPTRCYKTRLVGTYLNSRNDYLISPSINLQNIQGAVLTFWHWMDTEPNDGGNVQYSINGGTTWITLGYQNDPGAVNWYNTFQNGKYLFNGQFGHWEESIYDLAQFNNKPDFRIRFYFTSDATINTYDGWAVDDVQIHVPKIPKDAGVIRISDPTGGTIGGAFVNPKVTIMNFGIDTLTTIPVAYQVSGGGLMVENCMATLHPGDTVEYTFTNHYQAPLTGYSLCAFTKLGSDYYRINDSTCTALTNTSGIEGADNNGFGLGQNIPNPAGILTIIPYSLPEKGKAVFTITDILGKIIYTETIETAAGGNTLSLNLKDFGSGVYYYGLAFKGQRLVRKMVIVK
ncbi:MAG: GEVED domain-containing protein [Bacteroidota bacterium]